LPSGHAASGSTLFFLLNSHTHLILRLGELLIPSQNLFNPAKHVSCNVAPTSVSQVHNGMEHATFHVPWTKTTVELGADISVTACNHVTCPLSALRHHLSANFLIPNSTPLLAFEMADGSWAPMMKPWFIDRCNAVWVAAGFPQMPGHAFRIGGLQNSFFKALIQMSWQRKGAGCPELFSNIGTGSNPYFLSLFLMLPILITHKA